VAARTTLPADPASAATARRFVADVLLQRGFPDAGIDDAVLLTSEAVSFAVGFGGTGIALQVEAGPRMGRVEVRVLDGADWSDGQLRARPPDGRWFVVIQALAEACGVEVDGPDAGCIWFEVRG